DPAGLVPGPKSVIRSSKEDEIIGGICVSVIAESQVDAEAPGRRPAVLYAKAPNLVVEADAEDLVIAGHERIEIPMGKSPGLLVPEPDAAISAARKDEVVGCVAVTVIADVDGDAVAARAGPTLLYVKLPQLTIEADAEELIVAGDHVGQPTAGPVPRPLLAD